MRLALKLLASLAGTVMVVLVCALVADTRRQDELAQLDLEIEWRSARAIRAIILAVADEAGPAVARRIVQTIDRTLPRSIKWRALTDLPKVEGRDLAAEVAAHLGDGEPVWVHREDQTGEEMRFMYIPIAFRGEPPAAIEVSQSLQPLHAYVRKDQAQTAAVGLIVLMLSGALAAVLGRRMIGEPVHAIAEAIHAIGEGGEVEVPPVRRGDELGALAAEVSDLGVRLAERRRLEHEDRLRTIGQLASGVAHELGTPLSVIGLRARMIASGEATGAEASATAAAIIEQSERMTRLVRQLLDYARRESAPPAIVDIRDVARTAIEMLEPLARKRGVTIATRGPDDPLPISIDRGQLEQVITNLAMNALQATPAGGTIEVALESARATPPRAGRRAGDYVRIAVIDHGPGIDAASLPRVFEPFFTTKEVGEGTGLGLSIAQAIVEEQGGWIAVESELGKGARFSVFLAAAPAAGVERLAS